MQKVRRFCRTVLDILFAFLYTALAVGSFGCATHMRDVDIEDSTMTARARQRVLANGSTVEQVRIRSDVPLGVYGGLNGGLLPGVDGDFGLPVPARVGLQNLTLDERRALDARMAGGPQVVVIERDTTQLEKEKRLLTVCLELVAKTKKVDAKCKKVLETAKTVKK